MANDLYVYNVRWSDRSLEYFMDTCRHQCFPFWRTTPAHQRCIRQTAQVDHVRVTVYYTTPAGLTEISGVSFQPYVAYPNIEFRDFANITDGKLVLLDRLGRQVAAVEHFFREAG
jgi:hypothetical protein